MALLEELSSLDSEVGGSEFQALLLPLYIKFCQTEEREISLKSLEIIEKVVQGNEKLFTETVQELLKPKMLISVSIGVILISRHINGFKNSEDLLLNLYWEVVTNKDSSLRIAACKHMSQLAESLINR